MAIIKIRRGARPRLASATGVDAAFVSGQHDFPRDKQPCSGFASKFDNMECCLKVKLPLRHKGLAASIHVTS